MGFGTGVRALAAVAMVAAWPAMAQQDGDGEAKAAEPEVTLTIHHFLSPKSVTHTQMIEPWTRRIEEASNGRIAFEIFPSMAMGGKPPELYRQARDGSADIVWTLIGYTPGVFPRTEAFELPTVHEGSAEATNMAIQDTFELIADDYENIHPLLIHVHAGNALHLVEERDVAVKGSLEGLKLRTPSRTGAWMIEALGAEPVGMPVPELPQALAKGAVDGALVPFEIFPPLKLSELTQLSVEGRNRERFGTSVFLYAMNQERYEEMPEDLRAIIDEHTGEDWAREMGQVWDAAEEPGKRQQFDSGGTIIRLDDRATERMVLDGEKVVASWIGEVFTKEIDGAAIIKAAREAVKKHSGGM